MADRKRAHVYPEHSDSTGQFETYRENIDGQYWFPTYTRADDVLRFPGQNVRIREIVTYKKYKRFKADVKITVGDEVPSELSK